jgi:hypothetical protein
MKASTLKTTVDQVVALEKGLSQALQLIRQLTPEQLLDR